MKYLPVFITVCILSLFACKNNESEKQESESVSHDSMERLDTLFSGKDITVLDQLRFSKYAASERVPVDWSRFRMVTSSQEDSLLVSPFQPDSLYYEKYGPLLRYSPDRSFFIDIDSYNIEIHKDKAGRLVPIEKGPDTEVSLVDLENKEKTRLLFTGPGNSVEDATWIDNDNLLLIGYHETESKLKAATIWRYHIPTKTFHVYESSDPSIAAQLAKWRTERLRRLQ
jgi:hypothetical protein